MRAARNTRDDPAAIAPGALPLPLWNPLGGGQVIAVTGPKASGKTTVLDTTAAAVTASGNTAIAVRVDGRRPGRWLSQACQVIDRRAAARHSRGIRILAPSPVAPLLVVLADDCDLLAGQDAANLARIAATCRPEAVALVAAAGRCPAAMQNFATTLIPFGSTW